MVQCAVAEPWKLSTNLKMPGLQINNLRIWKFMVPMRYKKEMAMNLKVGRDSVEPGPV
jgi:hypothetical protein